MIPSADTLRRAGEILQQIEQLQTELVGLFGGGTEGRPTRARRGRPPGRTAGAGAATGGGAGAGRGGRRRRMSPEARARIAAAARARWARYRADKKGAK